MLAGMLDTLMLSRVSDEAVGAVGTANTYIGMFFILFGVMSSGLIAVMTQYIGQNKKGVAYQARQLAIVINGVIGITLSLFFGFGADWLINALGVAELIKPMTILYLRIVGAGCLFDALIPVFSCYLRAFDKSKYSLIAAFSGNVVNFIFNLLAVFVFHTDVLGVAIGTVVGKAVTITLCLIFGSIKIHGLQYPERQPRKQLIKDIVRVGFPAALETTIYSIALGVVTVFLGMMDNTGYAATVKSYASQITNFPYCVVFALAQANVIIVGWNIGRGDIKKCYRDTRIAALIAIVFDVLLELIFALISPWLLKIFTPNEDLIRLVQYALFIDIALELGRATNVVYGQTLKSTGDSIFPAVIAIIFNASITIGGSFLFGIVLKLNATGVFIALAADELVRAVFMFLRWRTGKWEKKIIVKYEDSPIEEVA